MSMSNARAMGPLKPQEIEALFVKRTLETFIEDYIKETEGQKIEFFDTLVLSSQKKLLKSGYYGYKSNSGTLAGVTKSLSRVTGTRTNNNSRSEPDFLDARRKYLVNHKKGILKLYSPEFKKYLDYNVDNFNIQTPTGGRIYLLSFLNKLSHTEAKTTAIKSLSEADKYAPDETLSFAPILLNEFKEFKKGQSFTKPPDDLFRHRVVQLEIAGGGRRRIKRTKTRRTKRTKTRRN